MLEALRKQVERARLVARALMSTQVVQPVRPAAIAGFVKDALKLPRGPHLATVFHAVSHPDKEALVEYTAHGVKRMTWGEMDATVNRLANALVARGAGPGSRVALMLPNSGEYLIAQQALARLGASAVQIGYRLKAGEIAYILGNAEPQATIVHADYLAAMTEARAQADRRGPLVVVGDCDEDTGEITEWNRALAEASPEVQPRRGGDRRPSIDFGPQRSKDQNHPRRRESLWDLLASLTGGATSGEDAGVIVYTSGTTGKSKGAHRAWKTTGMESVADMLYRVGVRADDRHLVVCPLYHSAAPAFVAMMLALGGTIVLLNHFEPEAALQIIERERVTCTLMVPTMLVRLTSLPADTLAKYDTHSLRWVMSAAAPLSTEAARRFMAQFGPILWNFYGATETGIVTLAGPADHLARPGTIGRAVAGNEIRLLDDAGHDVADGEIGELYARNAMLISGYHKNAEATQSSQRDGFFSVGDLGRRDADGFYFLESRKHDMVISGGVNIYPREIEDHLQTHPAILDAAVIGVPDPEWGERLRAFIVVRDGHHITADEVIAYCRDGLADYKRPRQVTFLAELPRNPTGKVLKRELRDLP